MDSSLGAASTGSERPAYVSTLLRKNAHMRPDPSTLPPAGRQDTMRGEAGSRFHQRKQPQNPKDLHVASGKGIRFDAVSVAHETLPAHPPRKRIQMTKGLGPVLPGVTPPVDPSNRCGIGASVLGVTDTSSWQSVKKLTVDLPVSQPGSSLAPVRGLGEAKRQKWQHEAEVLRGTRGWGSELRGTLGSSECYDTAKSRASERQQQLLAKRNGSGHGKTGSAAAPYASDF
mmetsp:Transcript_31893/g.98695  ORF Transcript_31893/g.98695 Transcript_31893/m.98695 type:complete len:229 (-) Transcript_31893:9-695(-)